MMAESAEFFTMIIKDVFRKAGETDEDITEDRKRRANAGYRLLDSFAIVPGAKGDSIDKPILMNWVSDVRKLGIADGRSKHVDYYIGHALAYAIVDQIDKAWPHRTVRDVIELLASKDVERGIQICRFNQRGMTSRAMHEGGKQERELAKTYREWATLAHAWPRTSDLLRSIADSWESDAVRMDSDARLEQMRP